MADTDVVVVVVIVVVVDVPLFCGGSRYEAFAEGMVSGSVRVLPRSCGRGGGKEEEWS